MEEEWFHVIFSVECDSHEEAREEAWKAAVDNNIEMPVEGMSSVMYRNTKLPRIIETAYDEGSDRYVVRVAQPAACAANELPAALSMMNAISSFAKNVTLSDVDLGQTLLRAFPGPRFGVEGVRSMLQVKGRPLIMFAIKPLGNSTCQLADLAETAVKNGADIIKDDDKLANPPSSPFEERVAAVAAAVKRASEQRGRKALYFPNINAPCTELVNRAYAAANAGADGVLCQPHIHGLDFIRHLASSDLNLPIMAHPAFGGSLFQGNGLSFGLALATLPRLAGADLCIFPDASGKFASSDKQTHDAAAGCLRPSGNRKASLPVPAGGLVPQSVSHLKQRYGSDAAFLFGRTVFKEGEDIGKPISAAVDAVHRSPEPLDGA